MDAPSKQANLPRLRFSYLFTRMLNQVHESQNPTNSRFNWDSTQPHPHTSLATPNRDSGIVEVEEEQAMSAMDPKWIVSIRESLAEASDNSTAAGSWARLSIYRIPRCLQGATDNKTYIPQVVSLGPYHHGNPLLADMESHKRRALQHIINRTNQSIEIYLDAVKKLEKRARLCYEGNISLDSNAFVEMMVLDSCFVLELLQGADKGFSQLPGLGYSANDQIFTMRATTMHMIQRDMIMLENQIPLFILDSLRKIKEDKRWKLFYIYQELD